MCVDLINPYTLKGKDGSQIDFMCLTMIDPASSWFKIVELPVMTTITPVVTNSKRTKAHKHIITEETYFDKTSTMISHLVKKTWFSRYPCCRNIVYDNGSEFKLHFEAYVIQIRVLSVADQCQKPTSKNYTGKGASSLNDNAPHS